MRVIPVIDLRNGQVVRAVAGQRDQYRPLHGSVLCGDSNPAHVATALVQRLAARDAYVADLDAIAGHEPDWESLGAISSTGLELFVDAGVGDIDRARRLAAWSDKQTSRVRVVVGLESVSSPGELAAIQRAIGPARSVFSLDLKDGRPLATPQWTSNSPDKIAATAVSAGFQTLIILDLARVGVGEGSGVESLCGNLRAQHPHVQLIAGGGVRNFADLEMLAKAGCDAVLVASALHSGQLTAVSWP